MSRLWGAKSSASHASTPDELGIWLKSFKQGRCLRPSRGSCDCCGELHTEHDADGELFELCTSCQVELTVTSFEEADS